MCCQPVQAALAESGSNCAVFVGSQSNRHLGGECAWDGTEAAGVPEQHKPVDSVKCALQEQVCCLCFCIFTCRCTMFVEGIQHHDSVIALSAAANHCE